ncbi:MAG TPA: hypothetical protein DCG13_05485 [Legionellales bacterium]|nr:hypothetical protein [Legionellales bacterium]
MNTIMPKLTGDELKLFEKSRYDSAIFEITTKTLAARLDLAWQVYSDKAPHVTDAQKAVARQFLMYVLNIPAYHPNEKIHQQITCYMKKRAELKEKNARFIPGRAPCRLPFNPDTTVLVSTPFYKVTSNVPVYRAIHEGELLDVNQLSKQKDAKGQVKFLTEEQQIGYQVVISEGKFMQNGRVFDTQGMLSHKKSDFAAFTLNTYGEFAVFNHRGMADGIAHSSMNAGLPVVAAGEIQIHEGIPTKITTHSGHYLPTLFNVYRLLEYLEKQGVDVSGVEIIFFETPPNLINLGRNVAITAYSKSLEDNQYLNAYKMPASAIYTHIKARLQQSIPSMILQLEEYRASRKNRFFGHIDELIGNSLTKERQAIAHRLNRALCAFSTTIFQANVSLWLLKQTSEALLQVFEEQIEENQQLSLNHTKSPNNGRLHQNMMFWQSELKGILTNHTDALLDDKTKASKLSRIY